MREGDALERLAGVKVIAFDKTGTLTYGTPEVVDVTSVTDTYSKNRSTGWPPLRSNSPSIPLAKPSSAAAKRKWAGNSPRPATSR